MRRTLAAALVAGAVLSVGASQASASSVAICAGTVCDLVLDTLCDNARVCLA